MYKATQLPIAPVRAKAMVKLPLHILLAVPEGEGGSSDWNFNLPSAIFTLLGTYRDWEQITEVLEPRIWAPAWDKQELRTFLATPFRGFQNPLEKVDPESVRTLDFPGSEGTGNRNSLDSPHCEIIHFNGHIARQNGGPCLILGSKEQKMLGARKLQDALVERHTRLLILQVSFQESNDAEQLAKFIVGDGGPAVVVVSSRNTATLENYFLDLYGNIIHGGVLPDLAQPGPGVGLDTSLNVNVFYGESDKDVFQFKDWISALNNQLKNVRQTTDTHSKELEDLQGMIFGRLHQLQAENFGDQIHLMNNTANEIAINVDLLMQDLTEVQSRAWDHEREGVIPLSRTAKALPEIETMSEELSASYPQLRQELEKEITRAPRVLNASFADPTQGRVLKPDDGLVAGREYDFLVDVGPRWNTIKSIVTGPADFPEHALPPDHDGYVVQVVVVSDDFLPHMVVAQIWVPSQTGRSYPFERGQHAKKRGPVALRLHAPALSHTSGTARARLCLYYENNLLQSAVVTVGVVQTEGNMLAEVNTVHVDYVLTSSFREVQERFTQRKVKFTPLEDTPGHRVMLNLTLNDDGASGHRIIINHLLGNNIPFVPPQNACSSCGWAPYDPQAAKEILMKARDQLQSFFFQKDDQGTILLDQKKQQILGLNPQNGKAREQFKRDLFELAVLGSELYSQAFTQVIPEGNECAPVEWMQDLEQALTDPCIIQVARTTPAQYTFPWALLYTYPMVSTEQDTWQFCPIIDEEWSDDGIRRLPQSEEEVRKRPVCPYHSDDRHAGNIVCPYGFWGLKHIIEQPPSVWINHELRQAERDIRTSTNLGLSIGVTSDTRLSATSIQQHLERLAHLQHIRINPPLPADDWSSVRAMLTAPEVVYFLCHGEYDSVQHKPYLSIGLRDNQPVHKIYPDTLTAWARMRKPNGPNLMEWKKRHPLIFINGCHTVDLKPGELLDFVTAFTAVGASGVVGTEVSVLLPVATEVAESLFTKLEEGGSVGQALYEIRWDLVNKGNLLGLVYTLYGLADLHVMRDDQSG